METQFGTVPDLFAGKSVLVTGGTGSLGSTFVKRLLNECSPRRIIIFSRDELKQSVLHQELRGHPKASVLRFFVGNIRDLDRLHEALYEVDLVLHAAALKRVDTLEYNPFEAVKTNILGCQNLIRAAIDCGVEKVLALSTDKAASPVNLYGATKLCGDKLFISANAMVGDRKTRFAVLRYGNVFASRGSVVPFFLGKQDEDKLPVTDVRMTRFSLSLHDAVNAVLKTFHIMRGGELVVPKLPSYRIADLCRAVNPNAKIDVVGIRPGEKLHEVMVPSNDSRQTIEFEHYFIIQPQQTFWDDHSSNLITDGGVPVADGFEYSSGSNDCWLTIEQLRSQLEGIRINYGFPPPRWMSTPRKSRCSVSEMEGQLAIDGGDPVRAELLPYGKQSISERDIELVTKTLTSEYLTTGPMVDKFELLVSQTCETEYAVAVNSGTAALHAAMFAAGVGPGDEVIVPTITFAASANAAVYQGATVVFCDVEKDTLNIDVESAASKVTDKTKAIVVVDMTGRPANHDGVRALADKHNLAVVHDAAHSLGARYKGKLVGSIHELTALSFHPVKNITACEGGMLLTTKRDLYERAKMFRTHGIEADHKARAENGSFFYDMSELGYNYRLSDVHCALGVSQLSRLHTWNARRTVIATNYESAFENHKHVSPLRTDADVDSSHHIYIIRLKLDTLSVDRCEVFKALRAENIGVNVHYRPTHLHSYYVNNHKTAKGMCPIAEEVYEEIITLPVFPGMSDNDVQDVINAVNKVTRAYAK